MEPTVWIQIPALSVDLDKAGLPLVPVSSSVKRGDATNASGQVGGLVKAAFVKHGMDYNMGLGRCPPPLANLLLGCQMLRQSHEQRHGSGKAHCQPENGGPHSRKQWETSPGEVHEYKETALVWLRWTGRWDIGDADLGRGGVQEVRCRRTRAKAVALEKEWGAEHTKAHPQSLESPAP